MGNKFRLVVFSNGVYRFVLHFDNPSDLELGRNVIKRSLQENNIKLKPEMLFDNKWVEYNLPE